MLFPGSLGTGILIVTAMMVSGNAQSTSGLPGGAAFLQETYDDWIVTCTVEQSWKMCAAHQELRTSQDGRLVLGLEFRPSALGAEGTMILPFRLALAKGASIQIDDGAASKAIAFRTCIPVGCIVPMTFDAKMLTSLRKGTAIKIKVSSDEDDADIQWSVSLKGFGTAFDRVATLLK